MERKEYVIRTQSDFANTYGLGEVVVPGVLLFRADTYGLSKEDVAAAFAKVSGGKQ